MADSDFDVQRLEQIKAAIQAARDNGIESVMEPGSAAFLGGHGDADDTAPEEHEALSSLTEDITAPMMPSRKSPLAPGEEYTSSPDFQQPAVSSRSQDSVATTDDLIASMKRMTREHPGSLSGSLTNLNTVPGEPSDPSPVAGVSSDPEAPADTVPRVAGDGISFGLDFTEDRHFTSRTAATAVDRRRHPRPRIGWRKVAAAVVSPLGMTVNKSLMEQNFDRDIGMIRTRFDTGKAIAVVSFKGGVGKSAITAGLGNTFATYRKAGAVVGIDTDEKGNLASRVKKGQHTDRYVKSFANDPNRTDPIRMHWYMVDSDTGFNVVGSATATATPPLTADEYVSAVRVLKSNYPLVLVDTDASAAAPVFEAVMRSVDALVVVMSPSRDSVIMGQKMIQWIREHDLARLLPCTVVAINHTSTDKSHVNLESVVSYFSKEERLKVVGIPFDDHVNEAEEIHVDLMDSLTRRRLVRLAAVLMGSMSRHGRGNTTTT